MRTHPRRVFAVIIIALVLLTALSLFIGRYPAPYWMPVSRLVEDPLAQRLVLVLRLPRILLAILLGASLASAGAVMQMLFRNPLVEPGFLGVSQGAAFGAALSILLIGQSAIPMHLMAIGFALAGLVGSYLLARRLRFGGWVLRLVLAGIAVSALFSAGTGILKYLADPFTELPEITFWLLGGLWSATWQDVLNVLPFVIPGLLLMYLLRWRLNLLSLDDETAWSLGAVPEQERWWMLLGAVVATAALTAIAGIVGWVGLIVPHLARRLFGADAQLHLPGAMLIGAAFTLLCDDIARTLTAGEIPLGILTSLLGAGIFMLIMTTFRVQLK
ncbi:MAG: iron ABC transporter permease [Anaerolineales bacterium]|nr:iron ABC transporter permease [Anaerolineales bacterium]